jgi:putative tryptophan/tyrosine transport system substrate-binding protein
MIGRRQTIALVGGTAAALPFAARAQQKAMPVVGVITINATTLENTASPWAEFRQGLVEAGYVEGRNVAFEHRNAQGHLDRVSALVADLIARKVDVILAPNLVSMFAAKAATATIPIVFVGGPSDPVASGLVASLARPGGNVTGIGWFLREMNLKRVELLAELVPQAAVIALLVNPMNPSSEDSMRDAQEVARAKGRQLSVLKASTESEIEAAFAALAQTRAGALALAADSFFNSRREQIVALAARHAVPAIHEWREAVDAGGLISYGVSFTDTHRQAGVYVGRILAGAKPADLPVQRPTRLELVINLKTANALGLTIPPAFLARADEVIE